MVTSIVTTVLHLLWCSLLVNYWQLDIIGTSIATFITYTLNFLIITIFCLKTKDSNIRTSFFWFTKETFHKLGEYLKIGLPSATMVCLDWWSFEVLALMAGLISVDVTGAHVIVLNVFFVFVMFPLGAHIACSVCVGKSMGEGLPDKAKCYTKLCTFYSFCLNLAFGSLIYQFRTEIARFFTDQDDLI
jgi:MATE family multidrug resistance protein